MKIHEKIDLVLLTIKVVILLGMIWHFYTAPENIQTVADLVVILLGIQIIQISRDLVAKAKEILK